jgi:hypothetical protein
MGKKGSGNEAEKIRSEEQARQARIRQGTGSINGMFDSQFNDAYFNSQRDNYTAYALPQLGDQHADALKELTFSLDRRGALDSSSRVGLETELERKRALAEQGVRDTALDYSNTARNNVESTRQNLISNLNVTGDAEGAVNSATARARTLSETPAYSPLSQLFVDFTSMLGTQAAAEKSFSYGAGPKPTYSTGLFAPSSSSVVNS